MARPKKKRRARAGESVYYDKTYARKKWVAAVPYWTVVDGVPVRKIAKSAHATYSEAVRALPEMHRRYATGRSHTGRVPTVENLVRDWIESKRSSWAPRTLELLADIAERHVIPVFGSRLIDDLTPNEVEAYMNALSAKGMRSLPDMVRRVLSMAYRWGAKRGLAPQRDPAALAVPPKMPRRDPGFLEPEQVRRFILALEGEPSEFAAMCLVGVCTGARFSELAGLTWEDIDLDTGEVRIRRQLAVVPTQQLAPLKTEKSARTVFLPAPVVEALKVEKARQLVEGRHPLGVAFLTPMGNPWRNRSFNRRLKAVCQKAGLPELSSHRLFRHSLATLLAKSEVPLHDVSRQLGHSQIRLTADLYGHHFADAAKRTRRAIEKNLFGEVQNE